MQPISPISYFSQHKTDFGIWDMAGDRDIEKKTENTVHDEKVQFML